MAVGTEYQKWHFICQGGR